MRATLAACLVLLLPVCAAALAHQSCRPGEQRREATIYWDGKKTANGERFNPNGDTAAVRDLAFNTRLRVRNPLNDQSVTVRINDRGPWGRNYRQGVRLDMARGAARRIAMHNRQFLCVQRLNR